jgi:hypothetical protein
MSLSRRTFIRLIGSSTVVFAAASVSCTTKPSSSGPLAPWRDAGIDYGDPRINALSYAILAPNPHNRQPWQAQLSGDDDVLIFCDLEKLLPETDPFNRQIVIGLGCFLELFKLSAQEAGYIAEITPFPLGEPQPYLDSRPVARIRMVKSAETTGDSLFQHVFQRRSNKEPFDTSMPVTDDTLAALTADKYEGVSLRSSNRADDVATLSSLTWRAHELEVLSPAKLMESVNLMRIGSAAIEASPDGIDLGGMAMEIMKRVRLISHESLADPSSIAFKQGLDIYRALHGSAMAHVWLVTENNSRLAQLQSGAAWLRINLKAAGLGVDAHPISQALQEFPEMSALYTELHETLGIVEGSTVQMLGRLGYGPALAPSPRWPVMAVLKQA